MTFSGKLEKDEFERHFDNTLKKYGNREKMTEKAADLMEILVDIFGTDDLDELKVLLRECKDILDISREKLKSNAK